MDAVLAIVILTLIRLVLPVGLLLIIGTLLQRRKLTAA